MSNEDNKWGMFLGGEKVAELSLATYDFPWVYCNIDSSTSKFEELRACFTDEDEWDDDDQQLDTIIEEVHSKGLVLVGQPSGTKTEKFRMNVNGSEAWFRA